MMKKYSVLLMVLAAVVLFGCSKKQEQEQTQMVQTSSPLFKFGAVADVQYCDCEPHKTRFFRQSPGKFEDCVQELNSHALDFTIHLGDFIDRDFESYDVVLPIWEKLTMPKYHILGNHEFYVKSSQKGLVLDKLNMPAPYYDFSVKGWRMVVIDGTDIHAKRNPKGSEADLFARKIYKDMQKQGTVNAKKWNGALGETQKAWLEATLVDATQKGEKALVFGHFVVYPRGTHSLWNDKEVRQILEKYDCVVAYFNGHDHRGNYGEKNGVHYVNLQGLVETKDETAYAVVEVYEDHLKVIGFGREPSRVLKY